MAFTDAAARNAKPGDKPRKITVGGGLYLLVQPSGSKLWRYKYRVGGIEKLLALGVYPDVPLAKALKAHREARELVAQGIDPSAAKVQDKTAKRALETNSFEAIAREWLAQKTIVPTYMEKITARMEADVLPYIGSRPIADITRAELTAVLKRIQDRGAIETAHRARSEIGQVFRFAMKDDRATVDPTIALRGTLKSPEVKHFPAILDPKPLGELLRAMHGYQGDPITRAALRLAPMLFVRPGELRTARWEDFDLDAAEWRYIASKKRNHHLVPLASQAVEVLRDLLPLTGPAGFVFPGARTKHRPMSENTVNAALRRLGFPVGTVTGHGFRASARTLLAELGWRTDAIERQLAHAASGPLGGAYDRAQFLAERKRMMQAWADYLDALREDRKVIAGNFGKAA
ncbi:tyrosine-type recombinase/integrase [Nevskia sp.]|uniref:tyrosine-type recombinase/integrase n=1 Tax=Nevskia sp. TaxID=1929292 RepID=UPI003F6FDD6E